MRLLLLLLELLRLLPIASIDMALGGRSLQLLLLLLAVVQLIILV